LSNAGKSEINIPKNISNKRAAAAWLMNHPNKMAGARFKPKAPRKKTFNYMTSLAPRRPKSPEKRPYVPSSNFNHILKAHGSPTYPSPEEMNCSVGRKLKVIGKGRQGIVYKGSSFVAKVCPRDLGASRRGERQPAIVEYEIQKEIYDAVPSGIVQVYKHERCTDFIPPSAMNMANVQNATKYDKSKQSILFMEYCSGGSLTKWLETKMITDQVVYNVIKQVLNTLKKIKNKFPEFRHNDLHMENVFVSGRGFLVGDFGWARLKKSGTNPAVNTANKSGIAGAWGIGPKTDPRYDQHCFLNNLRAWASRKPYLLKTKAFLDEAVPPGYRGSLDTHVKEWRLKYDDPCPGLPTLEELLKNKYITKRKFSSPDLVAAKARLRKVGRIRSANLRAAKARLRTRKDTPPRPRITSAQLLSARRRLKARVPTKKKIPPSLLKNSRFNKIIEYYWDLNGRKSGKNYEDAWTSARNKAIRLVERRLNNGNAPLSPVKSVRKPKAKSVSPPKPKALNFEKSPSGRIKVRNPQTGRFVYANGPTISLSYLKNLATRRGVNIKGLRAKNAIAKKIFS